MHSWFSNISYYCLPQWSGLSRAGNLCKDIWRKLYEVISLTWHLCIDPRHALPGTTTPPGHHSYQLAHLLSYGWAEHQRTSGVTLRICSNKMTITPLPYLASIPAFLSPSTDHVWRDLLAQTSLVTLRVRQDGKVGHFKQSRGGNSVGLLPCLGPSPPVNRRLSCIMSSCL